MSCLVLYSNPAKDEFIVVVEVGLGSSGMSRKIKKFRL